MPCGAWRAQGSDTKSFWAESPSLINTDFRVRFQRSCQGFWISAKQPVTFFLHRNPFNRERTLGFGMRGGPSMYLLFGTCLCRGQGGCSCGLGFRDKVQTKVAISVRHIYIYICYPPPQLSTFFVAFQGTRGNMFPKLGVMFSF